MGNVGRGYSGACRWRVFSASNVFESQPSFPACHWQGNLVAGVQRPTHLPAGMPASPQVAAFASFYGGGAVMAVIGKWA